MKVCFLLEVIGADLIPILGFDSCGLKLKIGCKGCGNKVSCGSNSAVQETSTLSNVNLDITVSSLIAIVGSTGEGKTSSISAMLGELLLDIGS